MNAQWIFGSLTLVFGIVLVLIGLPAQIRKNYKEKNCGNSAVLFSLVLIVYLFRAVYAITIGSFYIFIPDILGIVFSSCIVFQSFYYRNKR